MNEEPVLRKAAWQRFVENNVVEAGRVRADIGQSWQRCLGMHVDPLGPAHGDIKGLILNERLRLLQHLVEVARPCMSTLYNCIRGSGFQVVLADEQGFLLEVVGDPDIVIATRKVQLAPGGNWSEESKGTNAIGTALAAKKPVQVHGPEHFCQPHHFLTCAAAPIFDPDDRLIGVLDVTGNYTAANPHTFGMVVATVNAVEAGLRLRKTTATTYFLPFGQAHDPSDCMSHAVEGVQGRQKEKQIGVCSARYVFDDIIGESGPLQEAKQLARTSARSSSTVLLTGESGTGKELFAQAIHNAGSRSSEPFVAVHCAALPESLIESELFGYDEGAFTGSKKGGHKGRFELASGGTIFLDEIGDIPLSVQIKLLRVIQERKVSRIGGTGEIAVDIRIIAATNKELKQEVNRGAFRTDLYYRLNVITINIPPLRQRNGDIQYLASRFVEAISRRLGKGGLTLDDSFLERIQRYTWPGNVRELESAIERAVNLADDGQALSAGHLSLDEPPAEAETEGGQLPVRSLRAVERDNICQALILCKGNISHVAAQLGIGRNTLYRKIKEYRITF
jgi:sigma-54 dependent transcriptional regulator, acetoin dehydrogenase operon transcriptional activator AcoR